MIQRVQVVALAISVAIGAAVAWGLVAGSHEAPVRVGPTAMSANDQVEIYADILPRLGGPLPPGQTSPRAVWVSRTLYDTCPPPLAGASAAQATALCGHTKVGRLKPDIEVALGEALARRGVVASFVEQDDRAVLHLHQIVTEATGTPAADGDDGHESSTYHYKRVGGRWTLQAVTPGWIAG
jgi:hypothetical protein